MNVKIILGFLLVLLSYSSYLLSEKLLNILTILFLFFLFVVGFILLCEGITWSINKRSLFNEIVKNKRSIGKFIIIAILASLILEIVANYSGKLWNYPLLNTYLYIVLFIPLFSFYSFFIVESYLASKMLIDYFHEGKQIITRPFKFETNLYKILGVIGTVIIFAVLLFIIINLLTQGKTYFSAEDIYQTTAHYRINFTTILLIFIGIWFVFEYFEYSRKKSSLIKDLVHNYFSPILAIIVGSILTAVLMESQNFPVQLWQYVNWPLEEIKILGLPIMVYLAWPLQYIPFLSLFRIMTEKESDEIWRGDLIK